MTSLQTRSRAAPGSSMIRIRSCPVRAEAMESRFFIPPDSFPTGTRRTVSYTHLDVYKRQDVSQSIAEAFRVSHIVLASPTYNGGLYPAMEHVLLDMKALNLQNRTVALIENGSWASTSAKQMRAILETMKNITVMETSISVKSALRDDQLAPVSYTHLDVYKRQMVS